MKCLHKKNIMFILIIIILTTTGCANKNEKIDMVTSSNFVLYDFSRNLLEGTDIRTEYIQHKELSKADKNKLKNSSIIFCMGNEDWKTEYSSIPLFMKEDFVPLKNKNLADQSIILEISKEEQESVVQIIPDKIPDYIESNEKEEIQKPNESSNESETENSYSKETEDKGGFEFIYPQNIYGEQPEAETTQEGYSLGNFPDNTRFSASANDPYKQWIIKKIDSMGDDLQYAALLNPDGGYTLFVKVRISQNSTPSYKIKGVNSLESIKKENEKVTVYAEPELKEILESQSYAKTAYIDWHYWMSFDNMEKMINNMAETLAENFPLQGELIMENKNSYLEKIMEMKREYQKAVYESKNKTIFVCGNMYYSSLFDEMGIKYLSIYDFEQGDTADIQRLGNMAEVINQYGIRFIIKDENSSKSGFDSLCTATNKNVNILILDTGEYAGEEENFMEILKNNLIMLKKAII